MPETGTASERQFVNQVNFLNQLCKLMQTYSKKKKNNAHNPTLKGVNIHEIDEQLVSKQTGA